jgi:hypothetical protein
VPSFELRGCLIRAHRQSVITLLVVTCGCAAMLPAQRDPAREAEQKERATCPLGEEPDYPAELFDARSVVGVKPLYSMVNAARNGPEYRLTGAAIQLKPIPSLSSEHLESVLNCHNARSELARSGEPVVPDDPYWIPGQLTEVSVRSESGVLRAEVRASDIDTAKEILRRALAFAGKQNQ